jgi:Ca2+-binding EF-hand superfamily protein
MPSPTAKRFLSIARDLKSGSHDSAAPPVATPPKQLEGLTLKPPRTLEQVADGLLKRFDQNTDQKISALELSAVLNPKGKFDLVEKMVGNLLTKLDTTADGVVDKAEWTAALKGLDKNADGVLSRADLHHGPHALIALVGSLPQHELPSGG